jgi:hypothetical protein
MELASSGLGGIRIARKLSERYSLDVCPGTINHWIYGDHKPRLRNIFRVGPSKALSYIIGANIGDGCTLAKSGLVKLEVTDMDFAQTFNTNMAELFSRKTPNKILARQFKSARLPLFIVKYSSRQLVSVLRLPEKKLLKLAFAFPREFLRGFFDAEGHVDVSASDSFRLCVGAENSDRILLVRIKTILLASFGIHSRINRKRRVGTRKTIRGESFQMKRTSFSLMVGRLDSVMKFADEIGFSILRKSQKLEDALTVFEKCGRRNGSTAWNELYTKKRGEWVRHESPHRT